MLYADRQTDIRYIRSHLLGAEYYKYQLSLIDPRDKIGLQTELDDFCDKLQWSSFGHRAMEVGGIVKLIKLVEIR